MVEDEAPNHGRSRQGEERRPSLEQRPRLRHLVVFHGRNRLPGRGDVAIKQVEDLLTARQFRGLVGFAPGRGDVPRGRRDDPFNPAQDSGRWLAFQPIVWGFGDGLANPACARETPSTFRVFAISRSNSGSIDSA